MTEASYTAWDDKQYVWPPPEGWYQASDGKWWPEGYGPPEAAAAAETASDEASEVTGESTSDPAAGEPAAAASGGTTVDVGTAEGLATSVFEPVADASEAVADGSQAFSAAPMEMNDLSSVAGTDVSELTGGLADSAAAAGSGLTEALGDADIPDAVDSGLVDSGLVDSGPVDSDLVDGADDPSIAQLENSMQQMDAAYEGLTNSVPSLDENATQVIPTELPAPSFDPSVAPLQGTELGDLPAPELPQGGFESGSPQGGFESGSPQGGFESGSPQGGFESGSPQGGFDFGSPPSNFAGGEAGGFSAPAGSGFAAPPPAAAGFTPPPAPDFNAPTQSASADLGYGAAASGPAAVGPYPQAALQAESKRSRSIGPILALLGVVLLAGIGAALYFSGIFGGDDTVDTEETSVGPGSFTQPHSRETGVVVFYPDGGTNQRWVVEVLDPVRDATAERTESGAAAPDSGDLFATTRIRIRNESGVDGASLNDLDLNAVTANGELIVREDNQCSSSANDFDYSALVAVGSSVEGEVCWAVPAAGLAGLLLGIESEKVAGRVHIALQ